MPRREWAHLSGNASGYYSSEECFHSMCQESAIPSLRICLGTSLGGAVVKNPPTNARDMGLIPGLGRSHMPRSN